MSAHHAPPLFFYAALQRRIVMAASSMVLGLLAACSGSSGGGGTVTTPVSGFVSKAPVTGATCKLYNSANQVIGTVTTSAAGTIDFGRVADVGAVYAQCVGGTYKDEATGLTVTNTTLTSGAVIVSGNSIKIAITPLTQLAFSRGGSSAANVAAQAKIIAQAFGISDIDILAIDPTDLNTTAAGVDKAGRYGTMLAVIAQAMKDGNLTLDALLTQLLAGVNNDGTQSAANVNFLKQAVANLTDATKNNNSAVRANAAPAQTNVSTGLGASSGAASSVILSAANPSSFIQGAAGPANWTLTGTGLTNNMPITLGGTVCSGKGTANLAGTQLSGVNCSNVTAGAAATSIELAVSNPITVNTKQAITLTVAPVPTLQFTLNPATMQLGSASNVTVAASSASSGAVSYSSGSTSVATIDASTGVVTTVGAGTTVITATQAAVTGLYSGTTANYTLTVSTRTVPTLAFTSASKSVTLGDADFTNAIATKTCSTESGYNPTVSYTSGTPASATVDSSSGSVALKTHGHVKVTKIQKR